MSISLQSPTPNSKFAPGANITVRGTQGPSTGVKVTTSPTSPTQYDDMTSTPDGNGWKYDNYTLPTTPGVYYLHVRGPAGGGKLDKVLFEITPTSIPTLTVGGAG